MDLFTKLATEFQEHTGCSEKQALHTTKKYMLLVGIQLIKHLDKSEYNFFYIANKSITDSLQSITVKGKKIEVTPVFEILPSRLYNVIERGSPGIKKITKIKMNCSLEEFFIAMNDKPSLITEIYKDFKDEIDRDEIDEIPIDVRSLRNFINHNKLKDRDQLTPRAAQAFNRHLFEALKVMMIAEHLDEKMPHVIASSNFARKFYKGPNLQNISKVVRLAALGDCYEYDLESSVFAWKYSWYKSYSEMKDYTWYSLSYTDEYLNKKQAIRAKIARDIFGNDDDFSVKLIKQAITAIGFGAPLRLTGFVKSGKYERSALNEIIFDRTKLEKFVNNPWIQNFYAEQMVINNLIMEHVNESGECDFLKTIPDLVNARGSLKTRSVISYKYQQAEREILDWLVNECQSAEILLTVHDCIYTRNRIDLKEIRISLKEFGEFFKITEEHHAPYNSVVDDSEHRAFIAQEEARAKGYISDLADNGRIKIKRTQETARITVEQNDNDSYDGGCSYGPQYDPENDPFLEDLTEEERSEYRVARNKVLAQESDLPEWYK